MKKAFTAGLPLKKKYGQHFLRADWVVDSIINKAELKSDASVFEIGCGDGFLTEGILATGVERLWAFEIDEDWVELVRKKFQDKRLTVFHENFLDFDFSKFEPNKPWILLANLPYQVTFPILYLLQKNINLLSYGVIMVQEEVAQKIVKTSGRGYGFASLFFQHFFDWELMDKVLPSAFKPPPKVHSRLMYFKPRRELESIVNEEQFWRFVKQIFRQPRRTLKNNFASTSFDISKISPDILRLRAQQISKQGLLEIWDTLNS